MECSQPAPPKPRVANAPALTLALASPPSVEAGDYADGQGLAWLAWPSSHRLPIHQRHCKTRRATTLPVPRFILTDPVITMLACVQHHTRCSCIAITTTAFPPSRYQQHA